MLLRVMERISVMALNLLPLLCQKILIIKFNSYTTPPVLRTHICKVFFKIWFTKNGLKSWTVKGNKAVTLISPLLKNTFTPWGHK